MCFVRSLSICSRWLLRLEIRKLLRCSYARIDATAQPQPNTSCTPIKATPPLIRRECCLDLSDHGARALLEAARTDDTVNLARLISNILKLAQLTERSLMDEYFSTVHIWLPIVGEERFRRRVNPLPQVDNTSLATLLLSLFLLTRRPCSDDEHPMRNLLYQTTKQLFMIQASGDATLGLLQAGLILTYYACGHGLPREARMILSTCLAIAQLMGMDFENFSGNPDLGNESSSCCWAIVLLDRFVSIVLITQGKGC